MIIIFVEKKKKKKTACKDSVLSVINFVLHSSFCTIFAFSATSSLIHRFSLLYTFSVLQCQCALSMCVWLFWGCKYSDSIGLWERVVTFVEHYIVSVFTFECNLHGKISSDNWSSLWPDFTWKENDKRFVWVVNQWTFFLILYQLKK